ncbi:MAG: pyridinium-3,5-bisthiocarboxylic acid mononucleotide nickel chelatase, partial [Actinomycetota bacterium]|nr:pyridinium-3,5-bisthiocarboxylic acid mononucleotide nickel chelatase [Actinomycetota bacterium]
IDDMNPELVPYAIERIIEAGAADAWVTPITMKKGRSAITLSVLALRPRLDAVLDVLYRETTTLGVRIRDVEKDELDRHHTSVDVAGHPVRVKIASRKGTVVTASPEFEDARKVAQITGMPLKDVYREALARFSVSPEGASAPENYKSRGG